MVKASELIAKFQYAIDNHWGYIWGTAGVKWTEAKQKALEQTTDADREMGRKYGKKWIGHMVADCSGLFYWAYKQLGGYMYHGSNTMWNKYCVNKGSLKVGKRTDGSVLKPGTAVFTYNTKKQNRGHVGLYIGGGMVIEAAGTQQGVCKSKVTASKWVEWGELKDTEFDVPVDSAPAEEPVSPVAVTYPTIREGARGDIVVQLQDLLAKTGSSLQIDGIFGSGTRSAVRSFQKKYGLEVDGLVGPKTWAKLLEVAGCIQVDPPAEKLVTLVVPDLTEAEAAELKKKYPRAEELVVKG